MTDELFDSAEAVEEFKAIMRDPPARQAFVELKAAHAADGTRARYQHILRLVSETPWAIRPAMLAVIVDLLAFRAAGGRLSAEEIAQRIGTGRPAPATGPQGVAVLPLHGVIVPRADAFSEISGGVSIDSFRSQFRQAVAATDISGIVIDVDSPGGMVDQVPEMAAEIRAARGSKPIVAVANTEAASAAYWLASQADQIVVSKSARVGSIGVFTAHEDRSAEQQQEGLKTTLVSAGRYKTEGNPFEPLTDDARAHLQTLVDDYYGMFVGDVAKGRGVAVDAVRNGYGEGRVVGARDALKQGMADATGSLEGVIGQMLQAARPAPAITGASGISFTGNYLVPGTISVTNSGVGELRTGPDDGSVDATAAISGALQEIGAAPVDSSAWDGNRAMTECSTAAEYGSICAAEHTVGNPDERQHWAFPHHYLGRGPNAAGTQQALSRVPQAGNITDAERAKGKSHLETHMKQINPDYVPSGRADGLLQASEDLEALAWEDEQMREASAQLSVLAADPVLD